MFGHSGKGHDMTNREHRDDTDRGMPEDARRDDTVRDDDDRDQHRAVPTARDQYEHRHDEFGGIKGGAVFYGWLVAIALTILLIGIVGAIATAVGSSVDLTKARAELQAGTIGIISAVVVLIILMIGYFAGGYVAGRLARFDGGRQGMGVWALGLVVTIIAVVVGAVFGSDYDVFERVNLPSIPVPTDSLTWGGIITLAGVLVGTIISAVIGGKLGQRYHSKIDRTTI